MSDQEEITAALGVIQMRLKEVNANWDGHFPDVMGPAEVLSAAVNAMELSKAVDIFTMNIVGLASQKLSGMITQALLDDKTADAARASIRSLLATYTGPETSPTSLYWALMAIYNASRRKGLLSSTP